MEKKIKHLEFLQNIIARMNSNSFYIKGWAITLVTGILTFQNDSHSENQYLMPILIVVLFWILDAFYLSKERQFISKYNEVRGTSENKIDFDLNPRGVKVGRSTWVRSALSVTLILYYVFLIVIILGVTLIF